MSRLAGGIYVQPGCIHSLSRLSISLFLTDTSIQCERESLAATERRRSSVACKSIMLCSCEMLVLSRAFCSLEGIVGDPLNPPTPPHPHTPGHARQRLHGIPWISPRALHKVVVDIAFCDSHTACVLRLRCWNASLDTSVVQAAVHQIDGRQVRLLEALEANSCIDVVCQGLTDFLVHM